MGILQIGRVGTDTDWSLDVSELAGDGDRLSLSGSVMVGAVAQPAARVAHIRDQIRGLVNNPDEPVVPVTWTEDTAINGFYRVESASCEMTPVSLVGGLGSWRVDLTRVSASSAPLIESWISFGGPIPHGWAAYTAGDCSHWLPSTAYGYWGSSAGAAWSLASTLPRVTSDGQTMYRAGPGAITAATVYTVRNEWAVPTGDWLDGAAAIEVEPGSGGVWAPVVGRQIPASFHAIGWRLSNGIIRVSPLVGGSWRVSVWDSAGAAWENNDFTLSGNSFAGTFTAVEQVAVVRNSPEEVAVKCVLRPTTSIGVNTVDVVLRRGDLMATFVVQTTNNLAFDSWRMQAASAAAATVVTDGGVTIGIRRTSALSGNRWVLTSDYGVTTDLVNGRLTSAVRQRCRFGVGIELNGASATAYDTAAQQCREWLSQARESTRVAAR